MRSVLAIGLLTWASAVAAGDACTSAAPAPVLHPAPALVRAHGFQRLPRRMGVETLRMRDGFSTTLLREGCEGFGVTFDVGPMPAKADAQALRTTARAYMQHLLRADPGFFIARRFLRLDAAGAMEGRRLRIVAGDESFDIGPDDSEPGRLLIVYGAQL
jgi:hypothetical protein